MYDVFLKQLEAIKSQLLQDIEVNKLPEEDIKVKYLGRSGLLAAQMKLLAEQKKEDKPLLGKALNEFKAELNNIINDLSSSVQKNKKSVDYFDITLPGYVKLKGQLHPLTIVMNEACNIFERMGFSLKEGPEIETDYNNFTALNIPLEHPARDMHDTFYFDVNKLLRTHTSPVQIRVMKNGVPPFRIIAPGKVFRKDSDITHSPMFHQIEGLCIGKGVNFGNLKAVLNIFVNNIFGQETKLRFRPSFFPFTEPSAEVDISCVMCEGKGCRTCSNTGWLEILGAGMVHPNVLKNVGIDHNIYTGYAFGMGVERITMLKYSINDIRLFYENNINFLRQFNTI